MRTQIKYKGFYITVCQNKKDQKLIGTLYSKIYNPEIYYYYKKLHIEYIEENLLLQMKEEVDKFIADKKKYLEREIVVAKRNIEFLTKDLNYLDSIEENEEYLDEREAKYYDDYYERVEELM
jgi:hypothetical protein